MEALACSGQVRAVVVDGARPLATTAAVTAARIPDATRRAVEARDRHCRWAGCDQPLAFTDLHHLTPQARGGTHHPDHLVALCRSCHQRAHTRHWTLRLDGATGALRGWRIDTPNLLASPRGVVGELGVSARPRAACHQDAAV